jgi:hypothetical protein
MTKTKDFVIRIRFEDFRRVKQLIKPYPKETMANYFERIVNRIEEKEGN